MKKNMKNLLWLFVAIGFVFQSCSKENEGIESGKIVDVFVRGTKLADAEPPIAKDAFASKEERIASVKAPAKSPVVEAQEVVLPFSEDLSITARLEPVGLLDSREGLFAAKEPKANTVSQKLEPGTRYRVVVYEGNNYVEHKDYKVGQEGDVESFKLNIGTSYTFVSYSVGSQTELPDLEDNSAVLNQATLKEIANDVLLYEKQEKTIVGGDNYIDITLKHQFSQITAIVRHKFPEGRIDAISGAKLKSGREHASLNLGNGGLSYSAQKKEIDVDFGTIDGTTQQVVSAPISIISEAVEDAEFVIEALTVNGLTNPVLYKDLKITPGVRYNLILEFDARCIKDTDERYIIMDEDSDTETFPLPAADYGFVFDIYDLDNSFDMEINGVHLLSGQKRTQRCSLGSGTWSGSGTGWETNSFIDVNFEINKGESIGQNIRFKDGSRYGQGGVPEVYHLEGDVENPILRVVIEKDGSVSYYGSKENRGPLFPLEIITDVIEYEVPGCGVFGGGKRVAQAKYVENQITWHANQPNVVKIFQAKIGATHLNATGYGQQKVSCEDM